MASLYSSEKKNEVVMERMYFGFSSVLDFLILLLAVLFLILSGVGYIAYTKSAQKKVSAGSPPGKEHWLTTWLKENGGPLIVMWIFLLILPFLLGKEGDGGIYDFWWNALSQWQVLVLLLGFILFGVMQFHDPNKPFRYKLAKIGIWVLGLAFLWLLFVGPEKSRVYWKEFNAPTVHVVNAKSSFTGQRAFQAEVIKFWFDNLEPKKAWDMVDTIGRESTGFYHYNADGTVLRGKLNPNDVGVMQINTVESVDEIREAGCNIELLDCQFKTALLIYKRGGPDRWLAYKLVKDMPVTVTEVLAPVGTRSAKYDVVQGSNCLYEVDREITAYDDKGNPHTFLPNRVPAFTTTTLQYSVPDEPPGRVTVSCR